jgi:hypothetical protein
MIQIATSFILESLPSLRNPQLCVTPAETGPGLAEQIPEAWWALASLEQVDLDVLRGLWEPVARVIPQTVQELEATLQGAVVLLEEGQRPSLLYVFSDVEGTLIFYRGFLPLQQEALSARWRPIWEQLPPTLRDLYAVHDGWYLIPSHSGGHLPVAGWSLLSDDEWRLEKGLVDRMPIVPERTVVIYAQGGGGYLGLQLPGSGEKHPVTPLELWSHDLANPQVGIDFWTAFDEWTSAVLVEMALRDEGM